VIYKRKWVCPCCPVPVEVWVEYEALAESGAPLCPNCDMEMQLTSDEDVTEEEEN